MHFRSSLVLVPRTPIPSDTICWHLRTPYSVHDKLGRAAVAMGFQSNARARVLDVCIDMILAHAELVAGSRPRSPHRRYGRKGSTGGRLNPSAVRAIRASDDKIIVISAEHGISEATAVKIRARASYAWVE